MVNITDMPLRDRAAEQYITDLSLKVFQGEVTDHSSKATMFDSKVADTPMYGQRKKRNVYIPKMYINVAKTWDIPLY